MYPQGFTLRDKLFTLRDKLRLLIHALSLHVITFAGFYSRLKTANCIIGCNAFLCSLRYGISLNHICLTNFKPNYFRQLFYAQLNSDVIARADNAYEIILIREKVLSLPNFLIERTDFASLLDVLLRPP